MMYKSQGGCGHAGTWLRLSVTPVGVQEKLKHVVGIWAVVASRTLSALQAGHGQIDNNHSFMCVGKMVENKAKQAAR